MEINMNEENHMGWKLVRGVRRDVTNLFKTFANTNSVRFEDFSKVWKEIQFSQIFNNRETIVELLEFSEELFQIVKEYLSSVYEFHIRVAALYTLYGLYFKQPLRGAAKIRFTKSEWEDLNSLIEYTKSMKHYDVTFIFAKLYLNGAYTFAATPRQAGLERGFRKYFEKRTSLVSRVCDVELLYRPLVSERLLNSLVKLESLYCKKKAELLGKKNLVFIDGKFAESLQEELKNYATASLGPNITGDRDEDGIEDRNDSPSESQSESNEAGESQKKLGKNSNHKSSKVIKNPRPDQDDGNDEVSCKKKRFGKKYLELLAKKKAEYYIQKLQSSSCKESGTETLGLMELLESEDTSESQQNV